MGGGKVVGIVVVEDELWLHAVIIVTVKNTYVDFTRRFWEITLRTLTQSLDGRVGQPTTMLMYFTV